MTTIAPQTLKFLKDLSKNNNREWFQTHKQQYQQALENVTSFAEALTKELAKFDPSVKGTKPKIFRIYRDLRFSKDKSPYKSNFAMVIQSKQRGYYLHLQPGETFLGGGAYMPDAELLRKIRIKISAQPKEFQRIIHDPTFKKYFTFWGDPVKTTPKDFSPHEPMIEYIKFKHFIMRHNVTDKEVLDKKFVLHCAKVFKAMTPFSVFLHEAEEGNVSLEL